MRWWASQIHFLPSLLCSLPQERSQWTLSPRGPCPLVCNMEKCQELAGGRKRPQEIFLPVTCPVPWHSSDCGRVLSRSQLRWGCPLHGCSFHQAQVTLVLPLLLPALAVIGFPSVRGGVLNPDHNSVKNPAVKHLFQNSDEMCCLSLIDTGGSQPYPWKIQKLQWNYLNFIWFIVEVFFFLLIHLFTF